MFETKLSVLKDVGDGTALYREKLLSKLREDIYDFLLSRKHEDEFFDFYNNKEAVRLGLIKDICQEIENAGFQYRLGFRGTGLFIFKNEVPKTYWG
jgi:hypothetical protein